MSGLISEYIICSQFISLGGVTDQNGPVSLVENIGVYNRPTKKSPAEMMKGWFDEKEMYNYDENSCRPEETCGHYTQVSRLN